MGPTYRKPHDHQPSGSCLVDPAWSFFLSFPTKGTSSLLLLEDPASLKTEDNLANWAQSSVATKVWPHEYYWPKGGSLLPVTTQPCPTMSQAGSYLAPSSSYIQASLGLSARASQRQPTLPPPLRDPSDSRGQHTTSGPHHRYPWNTHLPRLAAGRQQQCQSQAWSTERQDRRWEPGHPELHQAIQSHRQRGASERDS